MARVGGSFIGVVLITGVDDSYDTTFQVPPRVGRRRVLRSPGWGPEEGAATRSGPTRPPRALPLLRCSCDASSVTM
jgi:hypothetical protein